MRGTILVLKKELLEFSKDRKTMIFLAIPLLLYPVIFSMMSKMGHRDAEQRRSKPSRIVLVDPSGALRPALEKDSQKFSLVAEPQNLPKAMADDELDLKVEVPAEALAMVKAGQTFKVLASQDRTSDGSEIALKRLNEALDAQRDALIKDRFQSRGEQVDLAIPFTREVKNIGDMGRFFSKLLGSFLPYVLMISMYAGAMQHGAYLSAGERERGTLMSLLATRLPRRDIILGKQLALFTFSIVTALVNLVGMAIGMSRLGAEMRTTGGIPQPENLASLGAIANPKVLFMTLLLLIPLGLFFTAIVMLVGIQARNTREAATALTPGIFVVIMLGVFSTAPGIEKLAALPWVPVLNVSVAIRKLFSQQPVAWEYLVALTMTVALAATMTALATRILNRESALFKA
jgi:sodium transport system permease protein